jgi:hemoglobin/transferrin/lactoferrin receptor protein
MKKALWLSLGLTLALLSYGQTDTSVKQKELDEILIYANKFAERKKNIVQKIDLVTATRIAQINAQNMGDLLANTGNVFVQKSQQGGSSPVLRGFEASRVLLVVDGIRMNNAIYRAGHLQNVITVDQNMLERVEVLYGPASTLFGSDALGGVVHFRTKLPQLSTTGSARVTGSAFTRYSTANSEKTVHADANIGWKKWAWLQSYNYSDFGDTKMGSHYPRKYPDFGRRSEYVTMIGGVDTIVRNEDDRIQRFSGYRQWDITQKILFRQTAKISHLLNLQYSNSTDVPRYDRLQDKRNGRLRYAQWYYGPQTRKLAAYELNMESVGPFNNIKSIISYQRINESRHQREYRVYDRLDNRREELDVWAFTIDGRKIWRNHELTTGIDGQLNAVRSTASRKNIATGTETRLDTRYPNGKNNMNNFGVYAQHLLKLNDGKIIINDGLRLQTTTLRSTIEDNSFFNFPFTEIKQDNIAATGNLGVAFMPTDKFRLSAGLASGFRSPNVDDAARIFESNTASRQLIIPNPDIAPEYTYNVDVGISQKIGKGVRIEATAFYTWFRNAIALAPFALNGKDSVAYNGTLVRVFANQNVNRAYVYGFNGSIAALLGSGLEVASTINYTFGRLSPLKNAEVPLDHIPPLFGRTGISYKNSLLHIEGYALYNGWKKIRDYNPSGEDNAQYATADGTPSWLTLNLKSSFSISKAFSLQVGVENILDRNYRQFASGFSAPGRNFILAFRSNF